MTDEEFAQILARGYERNGEEFKPAGPATDGYLFAQVARAALGMANRRDGGKVVIGINDTNHGLTPVGISASDMPTWNYDDVAEKLSSYADPSIRFELESHSHEGNQYIVLAVMEFDDIPVLCKKDYPKQNNREVLRKGACYVRSRRKPETTEIPTQEDMRDLVDLATEKRLRKNLEQLRRAGGLIVPFQQSTPSLPAKELFDKQLGDLR